MSGSSLIVSGPKADYNDLNESTGLLLINSLRKRNKDEPNNIDGVTKAVQTCENLLEDTVKAIQLLRSLGVQKGNVISIISENVVGYNVPLLAGFCMGVTINPLNPDYTIGELRHALLISKPKVILCSKTPLEAVEQLKEELSFIEAVYLIGHDASKDDFPFPSFESSIAHFLVDHRKYIPEKHDASETGALIMLSSGTTGWPKGVLLTQKNLNSSFKLFGLPEYIGVAPGDTLISVLPIFHIFGLLGYLASVVVPSKTIVLSKFKPDVFLRTIQEFKVNKLHLVPPLVVFLAKSDLVTNYNVSSVQQIMTAGAALGKETAKEATKRFDKIIYRLVYGTTETTGPCTILANRSDKMHTVGKVVPGLEAKVSNPASGQVLGCMEVGEICIKGLAVMKEYVGVPNNNTIIDEDGFYHTGDIGYYDEEGFFYLVDRIKELIKYKGFQVSPVELEVILLTHPSVRDCGVIGKPDKRAGELPIAFVVPREGAEVTAQELVDYVAERISRNKHLYGGVRFVKEIPKNPSGKILRRKLKEMLELEM